MDLDPSGHDIITGFDPSNTTTDHGPYGGLTMGYDPCGSFSRMGFDPCDGLTTAGHNPRTNGEAASLDSIAGFGRFDGHTTEGLDLCDGPKSRGLRPTRRLPTVGFGQYGGGMVFGLVQFVHVLNSF